MSLASGDRVRHTYLDRLRAIALLGVSSTSPATSTGLAWALSRIPLVSRGVGVRRPAMARS